MTRFWRGLFEGAQDPRHALGKRGEEEAARYLRKLGYEILERNVRTRLGEIDLIARQRGVLVFVEVKTRSSGEFAPPELSVDGRKRRKLSALAQAYLGGLGEAVDCRFDVLGITLPSKKATPLIRHIQNAFQIEPE
ncbi:MAG: YraN family protein [Nitrospinota bacterium]